MNETEAYAVPGEDSLIDVINPDTDLTWINHETQEDVRKRYPTAERINIAAWLEAKAARQDTPIIWEASTEKQYHEMLNVLPPARWVGGAFLVGEPTDHHATTGRPRFSAYRHRGEHYEVADRPLTIPEFLKEARA